MTIIETIKSIKSFRLKIVARIASLNEEGLVGIKRSFPLTYESIISRNISESEVTELKNIVSNHLTTVLEDMDRRYVDLFAINIPDYIVNPFVEDLLNENVEIGVVDMFHDMKEDTDAKALFKCGKVVEFWTDEYIITRAPKCQNLAFFGIFAKNAENHIFWFLENW